MGKYTICAYREHFGSLFPQISSPVVDERKLTFKSAKMKDGKILAEVEIT